MKKFYGKYGKYVTLFFVYALVFAFTLYLGLSNTEIENETERAVCAVSNAFTVPGVFFFSIGVISWVGGKGTFDGLGYMFGNFSRHNVFGAMGGKPKERYENFYDYKTAKDERGRKWLPHYVVIGGISLVVGLISLIVYYSVV